MKEFKYVACARPSCQCPELEVYKNIEGEYSVSISDDFGGVAIMTPDEFALICTKFMAVYNTGAYDV